MAEWIDDIAQLPEVAAADQWLDDRFFEGRPSWTGTFLYDVDGTSSPEDMTSIEDWSVSFSRWTDHRYTPGLVGQRRIEVHLPAGSNWSYMSAEAAEGLSLALRAALAAGRAMDGHSCVVPR